MLGRALFAGICLLIVSALALPLVPGRVHTPGPAPADPLEMASATTCCAKPALAEGKPALAEGMDEAGCETACSCAVAVVLCRGTTRLVTGHLVVRLPERPEGLPQRLPAI